MSQPVYELEKILDDAVIEGKPHYLIKWKGYSSVESTWEPIENLIDAIDVVHEWKLANCPHSVRRQGINKSKLATDKTKKIHGKEHARRQNQLQTRLNGKQSKKTKRNKSSSSEKSSSPEAERKFQLETKDKEFSFGQKQTPAFFTRKSTLKNMEIQPKKFHNVVATKNLRHSSQPQKNKVEKVDSDLNGFKVVGRVTKQVIQAVLWCFDWEDEKICEVELKDGRKVNMKRDDVKKICPEKLLDYLEKMERARL